MVRTALRSGRLHTIRHGVYVAAAAWPEDPAEQHVMLARAEQLANPDSVISHQSAALVWRPPSPGSSRWAEQPVSITLPAEGHSSRSGAAMHRLSQLPPDQVTFDAARHPVTTPARTAVDLAAGLALPEALVLLDSAMRRECQRFVVSPRRRDFANPRLAKAARERLEAAATSRGMVRLGEAIAMASPLRESPPESLSAGHFHLAGLPTPVLQAAIRTPLGIFYPDFYWPEFGLIGECDGAGKYRGVESLVDEKRREQALRDAVGGMVRWLASEIMFQPWIVVERVARALGVSHLV